MKVSQRKLKRIIREEISRALKEGGKWVLDPKTGDSDWVEDQSAMDLGPKLNMGVPPKVQQRWATVVKSGIQKAVRSAGGKTMSKELLNKYFDLVIDDRNFARKFFDKDGAIRTPYRAGSLQMASMKVASQLATHGEMARS